MRFLISEGDEIIVEKTVPEKLKLWDIVLFLLDKDVRYIAHRIVSKKTVDGMPYFLTKGDYNVMPDSPWLSADDIAGKITKVQKKLIILPVAGFFGRIFSIAAAFISMPFALIRSLNTLLADERIKGPHTKIT